MKSLNIFGVHGKIVGFLGGVTKSQYWGGNCLKKGAWTFCRFKEGLVKKEWEEVWRGGWGGWLIPQCTLCYSYIQKCKCWSYTRLENMKNGEWPWKVEKTASNVFWIPPCNAQFVTARFLLLFFQCGKELSAKKPKEFERLLETIESYLRLAFPLVISVF